MLKYEMLCILTFFLLNRVIFATPSLPLIINTWAFEAANAAGWQALNQSPVGQEHVLNAVVTGCSKCEELQCDGTVGYGGSPDESGETTLDAMIMNGQTMRVGAVAGLRMVKDAISVARAVMDHTKHTLLVGDGATKFAEQMGFKLESLITPQSKDIWDKWRKESCQPNYWVHVSPDAAASCGPYKPASHCWVQDKAYYEYTHSIDSWNHDTIGMIAIDSQGHIAAGTSTNGLRHKIPGRAGDSPIPGAGAYADNAVGAAVATGDGDIMMRFLPTFLAVELLRNGKSVEDAAITVIERIESYGISFQGAVIVVDRLGNYAAKCSGIEKFPYSVSSGNAAQTEVRYVNCINNTSYGGREKIDVNLIQ